MQVSPPPPSTTPTPDELRAWPQLQTAIEAGHAGKRRRIENEGAGFSNEGGAKTTENLPGQWVHWARYSHADPPDQLAGVCVDS